MRVAIFGAGYAGLGLARRLERTLSPDDDLLVVDESRFHVVRHLLHRAIRHPDAMDHLEIPLADLLDRAESRTARVTDVDPDAGQATLEDGKTLPFDVGAVTLGTEPEYYGMDGIEEYAETLNRSGDAAAIRSAFLTAVDADGRIVIGGGGLTGIQIAGELAALADDHAVADRVEITLLEQADAVPPGHDERLQRAVTDALTDAGVTVRTGVRITSVEDGAIVVADDDPIPYEQFVWAGGVRGDGALGGERPTVPATLRLGGDTFALGDAAQVIDTDGQAVPATAQAAIRQVPVAATNVGRLLDRKRSGRTGFDPRLRRYRYEELGWMVSVGDDAIARVGPNVLTGTAAVGVKTAVGAGYLSSIGLVGDAVEHVRKTYGN
ncbi:MAG: NAD(P)/FAD-dependent oxidoreductase [Halorhabdus sp.]